MSLNWSAIVQYAISGALVSWPVFLAGLWIGHRKVRQHVDRVTEQQTDSIASGMRKITDEQTQSLLKGLRPPYQDHDDQDQ